MAQEHCWLQLQSQEEPCRPPASRKVLYHLDNLHSLHQKAGSFCSHVSSSPFPTVQFRCLKQAHEVGLFKCTKAGIRIKVQVQSTIQDENFRSSLEVAAAEAAQATQIYELLQYRCAFEIWVVWVWITTQHEILFNLNYCKKSKPTALYFTRYLQTCSSTVHFYAAVNLYHMHSAP